jgi:hypothetical protein
MNYLRLVLFTPMMNLVNIWHLLGLRSPLLGLDFIPSQFFFICIFLAGFLSLTSLLGFLPRAIGLAWFRIICQLQVIILEMGQL